MKLTRHGILFAISSPSGAGKSTIASRLLNQDSLLTMSISATTRKPRPGEVHKKDYEFMDKETFEQQLQDGYFLEHAHIFGNRYGTPRAPVITALQNGQDVLFDVDWQGVLQIYAQLAEYTTSIFVLPPSMVMLEERLRRRGTESEEATQKRLAIAYEEVLKYKSYDYVVVNDDLDRCVMEIQAIVQAERLRRQRQIGLESFVEKLVLARSTLS
jgi:guanylate kinase